MAEQKYGMFPVSVARRIFINAGGSGEREVREFNQPRTSGGRTDAGRFILLTTPTGGATGATGAPMTATAQIVQADNPTIEIEDSVFLYLDYDMFGDLVEGDYGNAVKDARGKWIAVNAPCSTTGGSS